jgi:alpha-tubulin suppressor-like RCC1 family protein
MGTTTSPQAPERDQDSNSPVEPKFSHTTHGLRHSVGITAAGVAYTWGRTNSLGQLGRTTTDRSSMKTPSRADIGNVKAVKAYVGGSTDSGHTAILDAHGTLWMAGCDRWQQLGLGSSEGGSSGYTWQDGKLWQEQFLATPHLTEFLNENGTKSIRDVALGGDHTLVLSSNQQDVYAFGKGGDRQLGLVGKAFVSGFVRSPVLSSSSREKQIAAVCAVKACSMTIDESGTIMAKAGKCRMENKEMVDGLESCLARAAQTGLLKRSDKGTQHI